MNKEVQLLIQEIERLFKEMKYHDVITKLSDDILEKFGNASLYAYKGWAYGRVGEYENNFSYASKALESDPSLPLAYFSRGNYFANKKEFDIAIEDFNTAIKLDNKFALAYNNCGLAHFYLKDYPKAIENYSIAIELDKGYSSAYRNRGSAWVAQNNYEKGLEDFNKAIEIKPIDVNIYIVRGNAFLSLKKYEKAKRDYSKAIKLNNRVGNAYYNRALIYKKLEMYEEAISDFKQYIHLLNNKEDYFTQLALNHIVELEKKILDPWYNEIDIIITEIKKILLFDKPLLTHYTSLSSAEAMILNNSPFRISEGTFLNDTSEGRELFKYLSFPGSTPNIDETIAIVFEERPFIGSFVADSKHDDLTLWRMYGKEAEAEAKGCALTILRETFINNLKEKLNPLDYSYTTDSSNESDKSSKQGGPFEFYKVAYKNSDRFIIPGNPNNLDEDRLNILLKKLKDKIKDINENQWLSITKSLNDIAYLFKSPEYQYEQEVRLVVQGVGFKKDFSTTKPPKVYIKLIEIMSVLTKITLGPKVDKADEWAAAFNYHIKEERLRTIVPEINNNIEIVMSHLPFK